VVLASCVIIDPKFTFRCKKECFVKLGVEYTNIMLENSKYFETRTDRSYIRSDS
jgi:hypothetical protein